MGISHRWVTHERDQKAEALHDKEAALQMLREFRIPTQMIFVGSTEGLENHPEIFRKWFGKVIPIGDNKFSALNSAVFSAGVSLITRGNTQEVVITPQGNDVRQVSIRLRRG